jgi:hypothetical protein
LTAGNDALCVQFPNPGEVKVFNEKNREKVWEFDEVFGLDATQEQVYADVSALVVSVLDGYNVCIFACKFNPVSGCGGCSVSDQTLVYIFLSVHLFLLFYLLL